MTNLPPPSGAPMTLPPPPPAPVPPALPTLVPTLPARATPVLPPRDAPVTAAVPAEQAERRVNSSPRNPLSAMAVVHHVRLPSGLTVRAETGPMKSTVPAGLLMLLAYLAVIAAHVIVALDFTDRFGLADTRRGTVEVWGDRTVPLFTTLAATYLVAMAATAWWAFRVTANNVALGANASPAGAAGACFVPIAWFSYPFSQVRTAPRADLAVSSWQVLFAGPFITAWFILRFFSRAERYARNNGGVERATVLGEMRGAMLVSWSFVGFLVLAFVAATYVVAELGRTYREIDTQRTLRLEAAALEAQPA